MTTTKQAAAKIALLRKFIDTLFDHQRAMFFKLHGTFKEQKFAIEQEARVYEQARKEKAEAKAQKLADEKEAAERKSHAEVQGTLMYKALDRYDWQFNPGMVKYLRAVAKTVKKAYGIWSKSDSAKLNLGALAKLKLGEGTLRTKRGKELTLAHSLKRQAEVYVDNAYEYMGSDITGDSELDSLAGCLLDAADVLEIAIWIATGKDAKARKAINGLATYVREDLPDRVWNWHNPR